MWLVDGAAAASWLHLQPYSFITISLAVKYEGACRESAATVTFIHSTSKYITKLFSHFHRLDNRNINTLTGVSKKNKQICQSQPTITPNIAANIIGFLYSREVRIPTQISIPQYCSNINSNSSMFNKHEKLNGNRNPH